MPKSLHCRTTRAAHLSTMNEVGNGKWSRKQLRIGPRFCEFMPVFTYDSVPIKATEQIRILLLHKGDFNDPIRADLEVVDFAMDSVARSIIAGTIPARAIRTYEAADEMELTFHKNDIIQVITRLEGRWWEGLINGTQGWFPKDCCQIDGLPEYDAVSYCWADEAGDATRCCQALIGNTVIPITRNCQAALRRIRKKDRVMRLWVDAICIDQGNDKEKGHQVDFMPQIYICANKTYAFLGEGDADASRTLAQLSRGTTGSRLPLHELRSRIFQKRYFSRIWIVQEIALSRNIRLILGTTEEPWSSAQALVATSPRKRISQHPTTERSIHFPRALSLCLDHQFRGSASLLEALQLGRSFQATKAEDKVFALLGMVDEKQKQGLPADYQSGVRHVYVKVAKQLIHLDGGTLRSVLGSIIRNESESQEPYNLPSWVPDWRQSNKRPRTYGHNERLTFQERVRWSLIESVPPTATRAEEDQHFKMPILDHCWARFGGLDPSVLFAYGQFLGNLTELRRHFNHDSQNNQMWFFNADYDQAWTLPVKADQPPNPYEAKHLKNWPDSPLTAAVAFKVYDPHVTSKNASTSALILEKVSKRNFWLSTQISYSSTHGRNAVIEEQATVSTHWVRGRPPETSYELQQPWYDPDCDSSVDLKDEVKAGRRFKLLGILRITGPRINISGAGGKIQDIAII